MPKYIADKITNFYHVSCKQMTKLHEKSGHLCNILSISHFTTEVYNTIWKYNVILVHCTLYVCQRVKPNET